MIQDDLTESAIGCALEVHSCLGPGLLESAYEECLCRELSLKGIAFKRQVDIPIKYKDVHLDCGYRLDILVPGRLVIEVKAVERILPIHQAQLITYLRLAGVPTGLLLNFNAVHLKQGIRRFRADVSPHPGTPPILPSSL